MEAFTPGTSSIALLRSYPFCLVDLRSIKIIFNNFANYPELQLNFPETRNVTDNNIYSGLLQNIEKEHLNAIYQWLENLRIKDFKKPDELFGDAPQLKLKHGDLTCKLVINIYAPNQNPLFILIHLIPDKIVPSPEEHQLVRKQLDQCYRGLRFGEPFYNQ